MRGECGSWHWDFLLWRGLLDRCYGLWELKVANLQWLKRRKIWGLKTFSQGLFFSPGLLLIPLSPLPHVSFLEARGQGSLLKEPMYPPTLGRDGLQGKIRDTQPSEYTSADNISQWFKNFSGHKNNLKFLKIQIPGPVYHPFQKLRIIRSGVGLMNLLFQQSKIFSKYSFNHVMINTSLTKERGSCLWEPTFMSRRYLQGIPGKESGIL